ncbi:S1 family peptidase [Qipengyuania nanhaisediminis]|uniref:Trypsin-like peptidase domain-containing protein n=1 Tax=Qipengyuania nanhaisediminis TaxID=604088 RepID=A0A1I5NUQ2_9SPHN|nr:serine protease [Qipengyuania nanhaisediminis]SFP25360.1 Trypsin-like peptidase domain-containing protein [Qipengyuania nanhaisediminis]
MGRILTYFAAMCALLLPQLVHADPADIDAASRGVVRVVIIGNDGDELYPVSHGTGFAVTQNAIVTNAHVVRDAMRDEDLRIGVVPNGGGEAVYGQLVTASSRNDLALVRLTGNLRLPPLAIAAQPVSGAGEVTSVGYPMNVDRAQGLDLTDLFRSQPPVKSRGFISGERPSRQFDTILHTAPIARGNSGGPLLDPCGRVVGVNSFGADNEGGDAEFFFAVSNRELVPFLKANDITPRLSDQPCRSLADLDEAERDRIEREQAEARQNLAQRAEETRAKRERALLRAQLSVAEDREDRMALAFILMLVAFGLGLWAWSQRERIGADDEDAALRIKKTNIAFAIAGFLVVVAFIAFITRPGLDEVDRRVAAMMAEGEGPDDGAPLAGQESGDLSLVCNVIPERSRITTSEAPEIEFEWTADGCVNERTQYGYASGNWSRVFVPNQEDAVSVNSFDPDRRIFRSERYLLQRGAMREARSARAKYTAPKCGVDGAATSLGDLQGEVLSQLPQQPNERLVYQCEMRD